MYAAAFLCPCKVVESREFIKSAIIQNDYYSFVWDGGGAIIDYCCRSGPTDIHSLCGGVCGRSAVEKSLSESCVTGLCVSSKF